jgi:hypothetical protein
MISRAKTFGDTILKIPTWGPRTGRRLRQGNPSRRRHLSTMQGHDGKRDNQKQLTQRRVPADTA